MGGRYQYASWYRLGGDFFEDIIRSIYSNRVKSGDFVIDVGANHGLHTFDLAKSVGWRGKVLAIEALPNLAIGLKRRSRWNPNIHVINTAVSAQSEASEFTWVKADEGYSGLRMRSLPESMDSETIELSIQTSTLDQIVSDPRFRKRRFTFIKMDIEGGEYDALRGATCLLEKDKPLIVLECGGLSSAELYGYSPRDFFRLFDKLGFELFDLFARPLDERMWNMPDISWYAIAAARASADLAFVSERLPSIIERMTRDRQLSR